MSRNVYVVLFVSLSCALIFFSTLYAQNGIERGDNQLIQGQWQVTELIRNGEAAPKEITAAAGYLISDGKLQPTVNGVVRKGDAATWKLNERMHPKQIDLTEEDSGQVSLGIYELRKDRLKLCLTRRPRGFDFESGKAVQILITLKRSN